jgi:hypothetical protein
MKQERNNKCACGSGRKYKQCCLLAEREAAIREKREDEERFREWIEEQARKRELARETRKAYAGRNRGGMLAVAMIAGRML